MNLAREDAAKLHQAGVKRLGTDESAFISVLALRNMYQLQATFDEYQKVSAAQLSLHCFISVFAVYLLVLYMCSQIRVWSCLVTDTLTLCFNEHKVRQGVSAVSAPAVCHL